MLQFNQITYLFSEWAPEFQPRVALLTGKIHETHKSRDLGLMYEVVEAGSYDNYVVITVDGQFDEIRILIKKP